MAGFFGNPVLATYTGPTAQDAIEDYQKGQEQGFDQQRLHMLDVQQGRDSGNDNPNPLGTAIGKVRSLFGKPSVAPASGDTSLPPDAATSGVDTAPSRTANPAMRGPITPSQTPDGGADLWGPTRQDVVDNQQAPSALPPQTPGGMAAPKLGAAPGGAPMAGEFVPQMGRFATTVDGQQYHQMAAAAANGTLPSSGLLATRGGGGPHMMPQVTIQGSRPPGTPQQPIAPAPTAAPSPDATRAPAPAPTAPAGTALPGVQAQAAMITPDQIRAAVPAPAQFLADNGVQPTVSRPGLGTVSRVMPLLPNAYEAITRGNQAMLEQNATTGRTMLTNAQQAANTAAEVAGRHQDVATQTGAERDIAADRLAQEKVMQEAQWEKFGLMFGLHKQELQTKGVQDIIKGAQPEENRVTGLDDAAKMMELAKTNPSLMDGANVRAYMQSSGIDSSRISGALQELSDSAINPSIKAQITNWLSGKGAGVNDPKIADAAIAAMRQARVQAFQMYDRKLRANVLTHGEVENGDAVVSSREAMLAPDLYGAATNQGGAARAAGTGGKQGGNATQAPLTPKQIAKAQSDKGYAAALQANGYAPTAWSGKANAGD